MKSLFRNYEVTELQQLIDLWFDVRAFFIHINYKSRNTGQLRKINLKGCRGRSF